MFPRAFAVLMVSATITNAGCGERTSTGEPSTAASASKAAAPPSPAPPQPVAAPAGPQPRWTLTFADLPSRLTVAEDGTVLALVDGQLVAARAGAIAWRFGEELRRVLAVVGEVVVVARRDPAARRDRLVVLGLADGRELGSALLPADGVEDEYAEPISVAILAVAGEELMVGDSVARWFRLAPGRCAKKDCLTAAGRLPDETLDTDAHLSFGTDGRQILHEGPVVRVFDADWQTLLTARAHETLGAAVLGPDGLALVIDDDVVLLAVDACTGQDFAPSGWPQPNRLYAPELDECRGCAAPPAGCRRWRTYLDGVHNAAPALLADGGVVVHVDGETRALRDGRQAWTVTTGGGGDVLRVGEQLIGVSMGIDDDDPPALYALDLDGRLQWRTPMAIAGASLIYSTDEVVLTRAGSWLVAGYKASIAAFALP